MRICTVQIKGAAAPAIPLNQVTNIRPYFEGPFSSAPNMIIDYIWPGPVNYTLTVANTMGTDGCQGLIARNESDFLFGSVDFPIKEEYEKVNPVMTFSEEPLVIVQAYNRTHQSRRLADIVDKSFTSFSISLWVLIICFVLVMGFIFRIRQKVLQNKMDMNEDDEEDSYPSFFYAFVCFIQHDTKDFPDFTRRMVTLVLSVASFMIITGYFCNLMATDMVVVEKPDVMNSYDDILDRLGVTIFFVKQTADYEHFRDADKDSKQYKFWRIMTTERSTEPETLLDPQVLEAVGPKIIEAFRGRSVLIVTKPLEEVTRRTSCQLKHVLENFPDALLYTAVDPDSPKYGKGFIFRQANLPFLKTIAKRLRRIFEAELTMIPMRKMLQEEHFDFSGTNID